MIVSGNGDLVEALNGVVRTNIAHYRNTEYHLVRLPDRMADNRDRAQVVAFAEFCVGEEYGVVTIISIAISMLTGLRFSFEVPGQSICSGLVARGLERTSFIIPSSDSASHVAPADLAKWFQVEPVPTAPIGQPVRPQKRLRFRLRMRNVRINPDV
jgi:hypothetical protein